MYSYDDVAENYDNFYGRSLDLIEEDKYLAALIAINCFGKLLDIGSGTGWLLDNSEMLSRSIPILPRSSISPARVMPREQTLSFKRQRMSHSENFPSPFS